MVTAVLPLSSVAVKVTLLAPILEQVNVFGVTTNVAIPQLSVEPLLISLTVIVALPVLSKVTTYPILATTFGFSASLTVTFWVAVAVFPEASVTVHVTVVSPIRNAVGASLATDNTEQLSATAGAVKVPTQVHPVFVFNATSAGAVIVGLILSTAVTVASL